MFKRMAVTLFLALFCALLPVWAAAEFYQNTILLAVNTGDAEGRFTFTPSGTNAPLNGETVPPDAYADGDAFLRGLDSGEALDGQETASLLRASPPYSVGDTMSIGDSYRTGSEEDRIVTLECLAVGEHCTVWGSISDPEPARIDAVHAQNVASYFDKHCMRTVELFGDWYDADGDGKVAIFVYDIGAQYATGVSAPVGGYFSSVFLSRIDCFHVNAGTTDGVYSAVHFEYSTTSIHEFQHLINASYSKNEGVSAMESFLNEGMSEAAKEAIPITILVDGVNYQYSWGVSIYNWNDYAMNLIFVRYLRTRWAQTTSGDPEGLTVYKRIQQARIARKDETSDTLKIIAEDMFGTTKAQLLVDFWTAYYLKEPTGVRGFHGEAWADELYPKLFPATEDTGGIGIGGAKFFYIDANGGEVSNAQNLTFVAFEDITERLSGSCGDNATWDLLGGRLTIRGSGAMKNYFNHGSSDHTLWPPWDSFVDSIREIVVEEGITAIGDFAFEGCENLTAVSLPDSLEKLGRQAFCSTGLTEITIPDKVTVISDECFGICPKLTRVNLPADLREIYPMAFYHCESLEELTLPVGVRAIGYWAFQYTPLKTLRFLGDAPELYETTWEIAHNYVNYNSIVFEEGVTLYYLQGREYWQSGADYDAAKNLKYGFPIVPWGAADKERILTEWNGVWSVMDSQGRTESGVLTALSAYDGDGKALGTVFPTNATAPVLENAAVVKVIPLDAQTLAPLKKPLVYRP